MYGRLRHPLFLTLDWSFQATYGCSASKTYRQTDWKLIEYLLAQHLPGGPFSKDLVTYPAWKATLVTMIHLLWESALLICFRYKERQNNCQVSKLETCSHWRYKGIYVTSKILSCLRNGPYNTLQSRCVSDREEIFSNIRHHFWSRIGSKRIGKGREKNSKKNLSAYRCPSPPLPIFSLSHHLSISISKAAVSLCKSLANKHMPALQIEPRISIVYIKMLLSSSSIHEYNGTIFLAALNCHPVVSIEKLEHKVLMYYSWFANTLIKCLSHFSLCFKKHEFPELSGETLK